VAVMDGSAMIHSSIHLVKIDIVDHLDQEMNGTSSTTSTDLDPIRLEILSTVSAQDETLQSPARWIAHHALPTGTYR
jgi:hypothetical protein